MAASKPFSELTPEELIETLRRVADASLQQAAAINRQTHAVERLIAPFEQLRRDVADIKDAREIDNINQHQIVGRIDEKLTLMLDTRADVKELTKEITGVFRIPEDKRTTAERVIDRFEGLKTSTKILIAVVVMLAAISGWLTHLFAG